MTTSRNCILIGEDERAVARGLEYGLRADTPTIVQTHGGHIEVVSQPGLGSRFTIILPYHRP